MDSDRREMILTIWERLGASRVGRKELRTIQSKLMKSFGAPEQSPASIARVLVDEGADLKHPEVIEFDAKWREVTVEAVESRFENLSLIQSEHRLSIEKAEELIRKLEARRQQLDASDDREGWQPLRDVAISARESAQALARDKTLDDLTRRSQKEIGQWLSIWLQTPELFDQWLELRKRSSEFRKIFE